MTYEAGKYYETEKGGVVGPFTVVREFGNVLCDGNGGEWAEHNGEPENIYTDAKYGRLTTEASPSLGGKRGEDE